MRREKSVARLLDNDGGHLNDSVQGVLQPWNTIV